MLDQIIATAFIVLTTSLIVNWVAVNTINPPDWIIGFVALFGMMIPFFVLVIGLLMRV